MALPNKDNYIPVKMIYILKCPIKHDSSGIPLDGWQIHGVQFNVEGKGSTTSFRDRDFLVKNAGCKDITRTHWAEKAREWEKLVKGFSSGKVEVEPEVEVDHLPEPKPEPKQPTKQQYGKKKKG